MFWKTFWVFVMVPPHSNCFHWKPSSLGDFLSRDFSPSTSTTHFQRKRSTPKIRTLLACFNCFNTPPSPGKFCLPLSHRWDGDRLLYLRFYLHPCAGNPHGILFSLLIWNAWCLTDSFWWCLMACKYSKYIQAHAQTSHLLQNPCWVQLWNL